MKKNINILSLDPMYSCLHEKISNFYSGEKFALLSSWAMKVYLKGYQSTLISNLINHSDYTSDDINIVKSTQSHYRARLAFNEKRELNNYELIYMAKFANVFNSFIKKNKIQLVLIHNDLRWHHAIAISICKKNNIPYLVTEQGLFRPNTTVVDHKGVNAYSSIVDLDVFENSSTFLPKISDKITGHNSKLSKFYFFIFLLIFKAENLTNSKLKYQHNNYSLRRYAKRFLSQLLNGAYDDKKKITSENSHDYVFVPLQLEDDTQILIHSQIKSNQEFITLIEDVVGSIDPSRTIYFKKHPNDNSEYKLGKNSHFVSGSIKDLSNKSCLAVTINSSAAIDIIKTNTPLLLFGNSIYNKNDVAKKVTKDDFAFYVRDIILNNESYFKEEVRSSFINYLFYEYSLHGAGYSYDSDEIKRILIKCNCL